MRRPVAVSLRLHVVYLLLCAPGCAHLERRVFMQTRARLGNGEPLCARVTRCRSLGRRVWGGLAAALSVCFLNAGGVAAQESTSRTQIVLLGTGTPAADPDRSGPATAIVVDDIPYLVDFGPGVVRRAAGAVGKGVSALRGANLTVAFVTHLHSDHTAGYMDLIITPWSAGRTLPVEVYGPRGIEEMTDHLLAAYRVDIDNRMRSGARRQGWSTHTRFQQVLCTRIHVSRSRRSR